MALIIQKPWWMTDEYTQDVLFPESLMNVAGPRGLAYVRVFPGGMTSKGWGLDAREDGEPAFMYNYRTRRFAETTAERQFRTKGHPFALVTRSARVLCLDIDGKNGGFDTVHEILGNSPPTLAETSKSGNGYHLFYELDQEWDPATGYGSLPDRIGVVPGVDVRAIGCVYHYETQRWNDRPLAPAPEHLVKALQKHANRTQEGAQKILTVLQNNQDWEILIMQHELLEELAQPIPQGRRNNSLFAIGVKLKLAEVPDWEQHLQDRANELNMDASEAFKIVENVNKYSTSV